MCIPSSAEKYRVFAADAAAKDGMALLLALQIRRLRWNSLRSGTGNIGEITANLVAEIRELTGSCQIVDPC